MGKNLFVIGEGALNAAGTNLSEITRGKAAIVIAGTTVVADPAKLNDNTRIQLIHRRLDGSPETSPVFSKKDIVNSSVIPFSEGTAQKVEITPVLPAVQTRGMEFMVKVIMTTMGTRVPDKFNVSVFHKGTDYTAQTLAEALAAKINARNIEVSASVVAGKLVLTGKNTVVSFRIAVDAYMSDALVAYTVTGIPASGTPEFVANLESYLNSFGRGITNKTEYPTKAPASQVGNESTYKMYVLDMLLPIPDHAGTGNARTASYKMYLAEADELDTNHVGKLLV